MTNRIATSMTVATDEHSAEDSLERLLASPSPSCGSEAVIARTDGVRIGRLVGFAGDGSIPLVIFPEQPGSAALAARATIDLHGIHIGREVVLTFESADPSKPIILGCLRSSSEIVNAPEHVEIVSNGERLIVTAADQMVLRCGKASITLTKDGKVIVRGAYLSNQSSGVLRIKGGSVQIN